MDDTSSNLPQQWQRVPLTSLLTDLQSGRRPKGGVSGITSGIPSLGGEHLTDAGGFRFDNIKYVPTEYAAGMTKGIIQKGDILIVKDGATTGKASFVGDSFPFKSAVINEHVFICRPKPLLDPKYCFYYLWSAQGKREILEDFRGAAQGGISKQFADKVLIPVPPLVNQREIVNKIEELFSELDKSVESLRTAQEQLKVYRQALLKSAFEGKLPVKGIAQSESRKDKLAEAQPAVIPGINLPSEWRWTPLKELLIFGPRNGFSPKPSKSITPVKSLTLTATTSGKFDPSYFKYIDEEIESDSHLWLEPGDILIQRGNTIEFVGTAAMYKGPLKTYIYPDLIMKVVPSPRVLAEYLLFYLNSPWVKRFLRERATGTAGSMPKINKATVESIPIPLPPIDQQRIIIEALQHQVAVYENLDQAINDSLTRASAIKQAILKRAFSGRLVGQDPINDSLAALTEEPNAYLSKSSGTHPKIAKSRKKNEHIDHSL